MSRKDEAPAFTAPIQQQLQSRMLIEDCDLSTYVRDVTMVLLLDLRDDVELVAGYLMPLWDLLSNYRVSLDHAALALEIDQDHGESVGAQYREAVSRWLEHRKRVAERNRPH
jgi:hypothetical protein